MSEFLELTYSDRSKEIKKFEFRSIPFANSDVFLAPILDFKLLTNGQDVKRVYDLKLPRKEISFDFLPGDAVGLLPRNDSEEVAKLLIRLDVEALAETAYTLTISSNSTKKNPQLPKHIPPSGILKDIFIYYIDIRKPPKKLFLKTLIRFTEDAQDVDQLEKICSPKTSKQYLDLITGSGQTLLGLLNTFPSCYPPIEVILEHSVPLQPRYYSISSSPLENDALHITFFVVENDDGTKGVCTGWLEEIIKKSATELHNIPVYLRKPNKFRIPSDFSTPMIMVATGTGLAPFRSFLDHRLLSKANEDCDFGEAFLYYGCRYSDRDYLYSKDIQAYLKGNVLNKLYVAFSRETRKCYVQDKINENGEEFVDCILNKMGVVYICGNAKTMVKDVKDAVIHNLEKYGSLESSAAKEYLDLLIKQNRFMVDSWT